MHIKFNLGMLYIKTCLFDDVIYLIIINIYNKIIYDNTFLLTVRLPDIDDPDLNLICKIKLYHLSNH